MNNELNQTKLGKRGWRLLLDEINNGNVVLVLGQELFSVTINGKKMLLKEYILREIADRLNIPDSESLDFSQLTYEYNKKAWDEIDSDPYYETAEILEELSNTEYEIPSELRELLSVDKFKLVLTTSFDDIALKLMQETRKDVQNLSYEKRSCKEDIVDYETPCLYHMFGKVSRTPNQFVLTDDDLLEFIHYWLDENYRPKRLANILKEKYILVIGCNYSNWLFRFFFHSLKFSPQTTPSGVVGMLADSTLDKELVDFLSRMKAGAHQDAISFVRELVERWNEYSGMNKKNICIDNPETDNYDVFISYASEDIKSAQLVYDLFKKSGVNAWFDKKRLEAGDAYKKEIETQIEKCKAFVPILSKNVLIDGPRFFRSEWAHADDVKKQWHPQNFIYPIVIDDVDIQNHKIKHFSNIHINEYKDEMSIEESVVQIIRSIRTKK